MKLTAMVRSSSKAPASAILTSFSSVAEPSASCMSNRKAHGHAHNSSQQQGATQHAHTVDGQIGQGCNCFAANGFGRVPR